MTDSYADRDAARDVFARYHEMRARGHDDYCRQARRNEDYYLGGGLQWTQQDRDELEASGRPAYEINEIMPAVNSAIGYQIAHRMDIAYVPRGYGTDEKVAKAFSQFTKHSLDNQGYRYKETQAYADGLIQQRGYIDLRMAFDENPKGELSITVPDPLDVIPDPDATDYDPDNWADVITHRYLRLDEIENLYGKGARDAALEHGTRLGFDGSLEMRRDVPRAAFGEEDAYYYGHGRSIMLEGRVCRYVVLERQSFEVKSTLVGQWPTGDYRIMEGMPPEVLERAIQMGVLLSKRRVRRVRFESALGDHLIHKSSSLYEHFTIIPFFPYFRRGRTRGMVDNAISPQDMTNKALSQAGHILNSTSNSGWIVEEKSLVNMNEEELEERGAETGLVVVYKKGATPPVKIQPNQWPAGLERMIDIGHGGIQRTTGMNESIMASGNEDMSGIAIQSRQFAAQQQLAVPHDNLSLTRQLLAKRAMKLQQRYMIDERTVRITENDELGIERHRPLTVNKVQDDGSILFDLTAGEYDFVITEQPIAITFDNSQFEQAKDLKEAGVPIPPSVMLRYSTLPDKAEVAELIKEQEGKQTNPVEDATVAKLQAETRRADADAQRLSAEAVNRSAESLWSAARVGQLVRQDPGIAELADAIARSSGYIDKDAAPIIPAQQSAPLALEGPPENTHPLTPDNPEAGMDAVSDALQPPQEPMQ